MNKLDTRASRSMRGQHGYGSWEGNNWPSSWPCVAGQFNDVCVEGNIGCLWGFRLKTQVGLNAVLALDNKLNLLIVFNK